MTGREEENIKIENRIKEDLISQPQIIERFYYYMGRSKTPKTKRNYIKYIIRYSNYLNSIGKSISDVNYLRTVKSADVNRYIDTVVGHRKNVNGEVENGDSTIRTNLFALKQFYEFLSSEDELIINPFNTLSIPKLHKKHDIIYMNKGEIDQVKKRISNVKGKDKERDMAIMLLGIRTGLRVAEIININVSDIDWGQHCIRNIIAKGKVERKVCFGDDTEKILKKWLEVRKATDGCDALFTSNRGNRISYGAVRNVVEKSTSCIDKHITPHKLRTTCGTNTYEITGDIYLTANVLGHKNIETTRIYAAISEGRIRNAANVLDQL